MWWLICKTTKLLLIIRTRIIQYRSSQLHLPHISCFVVPELSSLLHVKRLGIRTSLFPDRMSRHQVKNGPEPYQPTSTSKARLSVLERDEATWNFEHSNGRCQSHDTKYDIIHWTSTYNRYHSLKRRLRRGRNRDPVPHTPVQVLIRTRCRSRQSEDRIRRQQRPYPMCISRYRVGIMYVWNA